jgi:formylglycine-generating enzyme required for sulfatase activity
MQISLSKRVRKLKYHWKYVCYSNATNYCGKLTERERLAGRLPAGYVCRLPAEAEWEYACRAGTTTRFSYGDDSGYASLGDYAWYSGNSGRQTHPVGKKLPNALDLYGMHGYLWEWCQDWYASSLPGGSVVDPRGPNTGSEHVIRGGSWFDCGRVCRAAYRIGSWPRDRDYYIGFRSVLAPSQ